MSRIIFSKKVALEIDRGGTYTLVAWWGILEAMTVWISTRIFSLECAALTIGEHQGQLEETSLPKSFRLAGNSTFPGLEVQAALGSSRGLCDKAERAVTTPLFPV